MSLAKPQLETASGSQNADYSFPTLLRLIEERESTNLTPAITALPPKPSVPALVEEPSTLVTKKTAMGGYWVRRQYADGTLSAAAFLGRGLAAPRYVNSAEVHAARAALREWEEAAESVRRSTRLLSGHARGLLNGQDRRCCNYRHWPTRTLAAIREHATGSSHTASYCREITAAVDLLGL